jgi:tRNA-2-methylthio-N6-dimethylallyladenosine synthase
MVLKIARDFNKKDGAKHLIELDFIEEEKFDKLPEVDINKKGGSAFVSVQEGCDKFCTFCVVPYTRGAEFSRPLEKVYREVLTLAQNGVKEIHLLGQNVNAYHGVDLDGNQISLASLIERIERIKGVERIRYTTSHPIDMTDELINLHGSSEKLMPFLHLPIQSGSDKILKAMNRKHNREFYLKIIEKIKKQRPDIALSSDFIVGFPGETDQDFEDTLNLVKEVEYAQCYSFKYSKRPGTPASTMPQVEEEVAKERLMILQQELQKQQLEFNKKFIGKELNVLFEKIGSKDTQILGKSEYMQSVHLETNCAQDLLNKTSKVIVKSAGLVSLSAEVI